MSTARRLAAASLIAVVPLLAACGGASSTVSQAASAVQSAASQAASAASSAAAAAGSESPTPADSSSTPATESSSPAAAAGSLCSAVDELKSMSDKPTAKDVDVLKQAAADIKANAPAEVAKGAASYAVILEALAASLENNKTGAGAGMAAAIAQGMSKDPKDITTFITYVATNCK
jgi:type II secretory pathway pseudopilin PulG